MKITKFTAKKVHGYLDFNANFNDDITFLTGINGTGKTTVINCINALITPQIGQLCTLDFLEVRVDLQLDKKKTFIKATKTKEKLVITYSRCQNPLEIWFPEKNPHQHPMEYQEELDEYISDFESDNIDHEVIHFIKKLHSPLFIGLERTTHNGSDNRKRYPRRIRSRREQGLGTLSEGIENARRVAEEVFRGINAKQKSYADQLRQRMIVTAFMYDEKWEVEDAGLPEKSYAQEVLKNYDIVRDTLLSIDVDPESINDKIAPFYTEVANTINSLPQANSFSDAFENGNEEERGAIIRWLSLRQQEKRARELKRAVDIYRKKSDKNFKLIHRFLEIVNDFLKDSGKKLEFTPHGYLIVKINGKRARSLSELSSGEIHIVALIIQISLNPATNETSVLIIDEPELSLHIRWQEIFVSSIVRANPDMQLICATHSPSIIIDRKNKCISLNQEVQNA